MIATTPAALTHPSLANIGTDVADFKIHLIQRFPDADARIVRSAQLLRREFAYWKSFHETVIDVRRECPLDAVILPYVDYCFYALAILGSPFQELPWFGISMRLNLGQDPENGRFPMGVKRWIAKRVLAIRTLDILFAINPSVQDLPPDWCSTKLRSKLRYLPDPAEYAIVGTREESRATLGIATGLVAILVFGTIDERKGVDSLLNRLASDGSLEQYVVILAGRQSETVRSQLRVGAWADLLSSKRVIVIDRFLTDAEKNTIFTAADVAWLGYRNHIYMSGVLVLAGMAAMPVVGTPDGEIGRLITKYDLGVCVSIDRPAEVSSGLRAMLDVRTRAEMGQRARSAFASHTVENFGAEVANAIQTSQRIKCLAQ